MEFDLTRSRIIELSMGRYIRWTQAQAQIRALHTARVYFRISLLAHVYYLFVAPNPFDIPRRRINRSADHRVCAQVDFHALISIYINSFYPRCALLASISSRIVDSDSDQLFELELCIHILLRTMYWRLRLRFGDWNLTSQDVAGNAFI